MKMSCKERYDDHLVSGFLFHSVGLFILVSIIVMPSVTRPHLRLNEWMQSRNFTAPHCELNRFLYAVHSSKCLLVEK